MIFPSRPLFNQGAGIVLLGLLVACSPKVAEPVAVNTRTLHFGSCEVLVRLPRRPVKLEATPVALQLGDACPRMDDQEKLIVELDMSDMPMHVAPVTLRQKGPRSYEGVIMFTMSGRWTVTLRMQNPANDWKESFDVDAG